MGKYLHPREWILPLLIFAFMALTITFLRPVFTLKMRWILLASLATLLIMRGKMFPFVLGRVEQFVSANILWAIATSAWSEASELTFLKSGCFLVVVLTCAAAAREWICEHALSQSLSYMAPMTLMTLIAAIMGAYVANAEIQSGPTVMYQGMVSGPNMFGALLAMSAPFLAWQLYLNWDHPKWRIAWGTLLVVFLAYLVMSRSRSSAVMAACTVIGTILTLSASKRAIFIVLAVSCSGLAAIFFSEKLENYVYKNASRSQGVFHTRQSVWDESFRQAQKGGIFGGGFGVTIGETNFTGGFTAIGYGREKGNTQLAIVEETGIVGLCLYFLFLHSLAWEMSIGYRNASEDWKPLVGVCAGALFGLTIHGLFEAWWVAPGSAIAVFFWILVWISIAIVRDPRILAEVAEE